MTLPTFIIFGTRKSGTTSLYQYLEQHPQVYMSRLKGTKFFHQDTDNPRPHSNAPVKTLEEYVGYFKPAPETAVARGEASPTYLYDARAASRMKRLVPEVRLIASLRNPVDRAYSEYLMQARNSGGAVEKSSPGREDLLPYLDSGLYAKHLRPYFELFDKDQIRVLIFEEWIRDVPAMLKELYGFVGVDTDFMPDLEMQYNKGGVPKSRVIGNMLRHRRSFLSLKPYVPTRVRSLVNRIRNANMSSAPPLSQDLRAELAALFSEDASLLSSMLGKDMLSIWNLPPERRSATA